MPTLRRWVQFLTSAGGAVALGFLFVQYGTPSDDRFLQTLSPELRERYNKEKEVRELAGEILQRRIEQTRDKPAWLQGSAAMRKLDREVTEEARTTVESRREQQALDDERERLRLLAEKERKM